MRTTLVIMAAGIGSRFGGGIKQLQSIGPNGEIIMDYSIHDAIEAGFNKIIFIIRRDIEADFREVIGNRIESICNALDVEVQYAFQSLEDIPGDYAVPTGRTKPWGTGQAVLAAKDNIQEPFVVINADDYYGKEAFVKVHEFLQKYDVKTPNMLCMAGFYLQNTLSENGGVTRGICQVDQEEYLVKIDETPNVIKTPHGVMANNKEIDPETYVSMNMWGLTPEFLGLLEAGFIDFFEHMTGNEEKAEFLLPIFIDQLLKEQKVLVKVLNTKDKWFGMTYQEDIKGVMDAFAKLHEDGTYKKELFSDLMAD